jgi:protein-S-isoprenylcysteine O-methyltransferase Ste14
MCGLYDFSLLLIFFFAALVFILLFFIPAPYGKFSRHGWGPGVRSKWGWMFMELPSPMIIFIFFMISVDKDLPRVIFLLLWLSHYLHRTFVYPFSQSGRDKPYPFILVLMAFVFNCLNGFVNGYGVFHVYSYSNSWLLSWQFITGSAIFVSGFITNKIADEKLRMMKKENPEEYIVPRGWLFNFISSPHYLGEIIEWGGWALMTWSLPGLAFFIFTFANLFPRAISAHRWYKSRFPDYPAGRKAVIPFLI